MIELSLRQCEKEFGVARPVLTRKLHEAEVKTGRGIKHSIKEVHEALAHVDDVNKATAIAKLKVSEEDGKLKELERRRKEGELVSFAEAQELLIKPWEPIVRKVKSMPARLATRCNPADPLHAREELEECARDICSAVEKICSKL